MENNRKSQQNKQNHTLEKFSAKNFQRKNGKKEAITHLLSKIKESGTFFNTDKILIKTLFDKLKNS